MRLSTWSKISSKTSHQVGAEAAMYSVEITAVEAEAVEILGVVSKGLKHRRCISAKED